MMEYFLFSDEADEDDTSRPIKLTKDSQDSKLWVDLYSPRLYIDLMSDEVRAMSYQSWAGLTSSLCHWIFMVSRGS